MIGYAKTISVATVKDLRIYLMPSYDYQCPQCLEAFRVSHPINESPELEKCANCSVQLVRKINFGGVSFNGSGFYSTDKRTGKDNG